MAINSPPHASDMGASLEALLVMCVKREASDLHLVSGLPPHFRQHGILLPSGQEVLSAEAIEKMAIYLARIGAGLSEEAFHEKLRSRGSLDGACTAACSARFRFNLFRCQGQVSIALRRLEDRFRDLEELGLPTSLYDFCGLRDGLVVVSGPTGAGKSTTLAALLDRINRERMGHIVTIEDPIEYIHKPVQSVINQRQIGLDASSFNDALVDSMRQDPDVILVGEIRDLDTIRTAITAAETGHLVFTTLHAGDTVGAIERLVAVFPAEEQESIRRQLSIVLRAIVAQHLLPRKERAEGLAGSPRSSVAVSEVLRVTPAVANLIATGKSSQLYSAIETGQSYQMQTLEQDLARLCLRGVLDESVALATSRHPGTLRSRIAAGAMPVRSFENRNRKEGDG